MKGSEKNSDNKILIITYAKHKGTTH